MLELRPVAKGIDIAVARYDRPVRQFHDERRIVRPPVEIDEKTRIAREDRGTAEMPGKHPRNLRRADVVGNVAAEFRLREPERPVTVGKRVRRMIADDQKSRIALRVDKLERREIVRGDFPIGEGAHVRTIPKG